jgi:hypothetical protein
VDYIFYIYGFLQTYSGSNVEVLIYYI